MSARSNSFKLQRLSKTMGIRDHSISQFEPKQAVKLPALNSINLGVKYNDLSYVTGRDLNKLRKEPEVGDDLQYESAHHNLSSIRKNYDSVHKQKTSREVSISKLKEDERKLKIIETELIDKREGGRKQVDDFHKKLKDIQLMYTEADMQKKVLQSMRHRLKTDKVVYDQRKFNMEKELRFLKKQIQVIKIDKTDKTESDDRTNKLYRKLMAQLKQEQIERQNHLNSLQNMISEKQRVNVNNLNRSQEMQDIAQRAMQDKDETQQSWQKLYLTNKFVDRMLRNKMDKQMSKFFIVESAFKTIKIATGVNDAETLVAKFLHKQQTYGDLLGKIAENQKRIQILKQEGEQLRQQYKQLKAEKEVLKNTKIAKVQVTEQTKKLEETEVLRQKANLHKQKLRAWFQKNIRKINSILGTQHELSNERTLDAVKQNFIFYLKTISANLDQVEKEGKQIKLSFQADEKIKNEGKLVRIKKRKDSKVVDEESEDEGHLNHEEDDLLGGQRHQIHRINEKVMKEIKRKHEELRKLKMQQASPKKREAEPPKKKPEED